MTSWFSSSLHRISLSSSEAIKETADEKRHRNRCQNIEMFSFDQHM